MGSDGWREVGEILFRFGVLCVYFGDFIIIFWGFRLGIVLISCKDY